MNSFNCFPSYLNETEVPLIVCQECGSMVQNTYQMRIKHAEFHARAEG